MTDTARHYDILIDENNDPVHDPKPLREYMDRWDGSQFIDKMQLNQSKTVLEIGVGTGRLAVRIAPLCARFVGIDISPKTISKAKINIQNLKNTVLRCADFMEADFSEAFDVIYSSLTFMHIKEKKKAIQKVDDLLKHNGIFALSIDKNQADIIEFGTSKIKIFPDNPIEIKRNIESVGMTVLEQYETDFAHIFIAAKDKKNSVSKNPTADKKRLTNIDV